jgi:hypothetical protein
MVEHYHRERNRRDWANRLIVEEEPHARSEGAVQCRQPLGGTQLGLSTSACLLCTRANRARR